MKIKDFYKPSGSKIVLFIALFIPFTFYIPGKYNPASILTYPIFYLGSFVNIYIGIILSVIMLLFNAIFYYSLSCLIIFSYSKIKK